MSGVRRPACRTKAFLLESPPVATFLLHDAGVGALPLEHAALNGSNESHDAPRRHGLCRVSHPIMLSHLRLRGSRCLHFAASTCGSAGCECLCLCADRCVCVCVCVWVCSGTFRGDDKRAALPSRVSSPAAGMLRTRDQRPVLPRWALELLRFYTAWSGQDCDRGCAVCCCIGARPARPAGAPPTDPVFQCGCSGEGRLNVRGAQGAPIRVPPHLASLARPPCRLGRNELHGRIE